MRVDILFGKINRKETNGHRPRFGGGERWLAKGTRLSRQQNESVGEIEEIQINERLHIIHISA